MNEDTMKLGLLLEAVQTQQKTADASLQRLERHTQGLDELVREQVRRALVDELAALGEAGDHAVQVLRSLARRANLRIWLWTLVTAASSAVCAGMVLAWLLPSRADVAALRLQRDQLSAAVARLARLGCRIDLRRCGEAGRLCVRVDRKAPAYGERSDYLVLMGY
jgi:hypothetical protein